MGRTPEKISLPFFVVFVAFVVNIFLTTCPCFALFASLRFISVRVDR